MEEDGRGWMRMDGDGGKRTGMDEDEQGQIERDDDGWRWTQTEEDGGGRMDAEQLKEEVLDHIQSQHIAQLNATITKLYQALTELQEATASINQRLARLESELNGQAGEEPEFSQLDLEELQVGSNPSAPIKYEHADLESVKANIQNGKPNRDAVLQCAMGFGRKRKGSRRQLRPSSPSPGRGRSTYSFW